MQNTFILSWANLVGQSGLSDFNRPSELAAVENMFLDFPNCLLHVPSSCTHCKKSFIKGLALHADWVIKLRQCTPECTNNAMGCCLFSSDCAPEYLPDIFAAPSYVWALNPDMGILSLKRTSSAIIAISTPVVPGTSYKPIKTSCGTSSWSTYLK